MKFISSTKNPLIKEVLRLQQKSSYRKKTRKFVVEGRREVRLALDASYKFDYLLIQPEILGLDYLQQLKSKYQLDAEIIEISLEVYKRLAYRDSTEGILGVGLWKDHSFSQLKLSKNPLLLIAENIEKPGNIGAMLRTADAANLDALVIANPITDLYNPNIIRSSVGGVFTVPVVLAQTSEVIEYLKSKNIKLFAATLQNSNAYFKEDYTKPAAIAVGSEAQGLTEEMRRAAYKNILIPMEGKLDSLNVSVSAAILIFEAKRQRYK